MSEQIGLGTVKGFYLPQDIFIFITKVVFVSIESKDKCAYPTAIHLEVEYLQ